MSFSLPVGHRKTMSSVLCSMICVLLLTSLSVPLAGQQAGAEALASTARSLELAGPEEREVAQDADSLSVVSAATFRADGVAPGQLVSLFGSGIGPAQAVSASISAGGEVPTTLGGVQVLVGGLAAPILFASADQINAQIPYAVGTGIVTVSAYLDGRLTGETQVTPTPTRVGLFLLDQFSKHAATLNQDGSLNTPASPAGAGDIVTLFGTGHGETDPPSETGRLVGSTLSPLVHSISARYWSGARAGDLELLYAGPAPGFVGLFQVNLRLPAQLGDAYGAFHIFLESEGADYGTSGVVVVSTEPTVRNADYYVAAAKAGPNGVAPGGTIDVKFDVSNLGASSSRPFVAWIDFVQDGRVVRGSQCDFDSGLSSGSTSYCSAAVTVPESLSSGAYRVRFWANPFTRANPRWAPEVNTDNNSMFFPLTTAMEPPGTGSWSGTLRFEGTMTLDGRTEPATIDIFGGTLAGQVNGLSQSDTFIMSFTNIESAEVTGDTISFLVRSDSLIFGDKIYGTGLGSFVLTADRLEVGSPANGSLLVTYAGNERISAGFKGTLVEAGP